ncbi:MAG: cbb3-type cytochrome c oxidase subunit I [Porticoccus sp.]
MNSDTYNLKDIDSAAKKLALGWIWLGVYSLVAAGILAILLALSRTPAIKEMMPGSNFFKVALVVHVDLSVLIWFLAGAGILWAVFGIHRESLWSKAAFWLAVVGTVIISISPFLGATQPLMNNYIPVILQPWFFYGLLVMTAGLVIQAAGFMVTNTPRLNRSEGTETLRFALYLAALSVLIAVICVAVSYAKIPETIGGEFYYDLLFWGGGHVHQFVNTVLLLVAWVMLSAACGNDLRMSPRLGAMLFLLVVLPIAMVPWLYSYKIESSEHILGFTQLMRKGGLASIPIGLLVFLSTFRFTELSDEQKPLRAALISSITLFAGGGILGFMIMGSNTIIPAHYHGSIVGVTMAVMGVVFLLLPRLGRPIKHLKLAYWMPWLYGAGQLMHITALAWSGGHGVKRKAAGQAQGLEGLQEIIGMAFMGAGGLIAVLGGVLFLFIVISALIKKSDPLIRHPQTDGA